MKSYAKEGTPLADVHDHGTRLRHAMASAAIRAMRFRAIHGDIISPEGFLAKQRLIDADTAIDRSYLRMVQAIESLTSHLTMKEALALHDRYVEEAREQERRVRTLYLSRGLPAVYEASRTVLNSEYVVITEAA